MSLKKIKFVNRHETFPLPSSRSNVNVNINFSARMNAIKMEL